MPFLDYTEMEDSEAYHAILQESWSDLVQHINPMVFVDAFRERGLLNRLEEAHILSSSEEHVQARALLNQLNEKGPGVLREFFLLLSSVNSYAYSLVQTRSLSKYPSVDLPRGEFSI
jgi:hypothetical protein